MLINKAYKFRLYPTYEGTFIYKFLFPQIRALVLLN